MTNYPTKKLGEVCDFQGGTQPPKSDFVFEPRAGYVRLLQIRDFKSDKFATYVPDTGKLKKCEKSDLMIGRYGASVGQILTGKAGAYNVALIKTLPNSQYLSQDYLSHFLNTHKMQSWFKSQARSAQAGFNQTEIGSVEIPLPSIAEQRKIVAKLERVLGKIKEAKKLREEAESAAAALLPAELHKIFSERKKKGWEEKEVGKICEHPQYGFTASATREKIGPKLLRITDIQNGRVHWESVPYCKCSDVKKYRLAKGDIVFARTGATVGKSYLLDDVPINTIFASYLIRLRAKDAVIPEFLYYFFQSPDYWIQITEHSVGGAQPNVNGSKLGKIKIPLPPIAEQKKIVARLDAFSAKVQNLRQSQTQTASDFTALEQSVLHQALSS